MTSAEYNLNIEIGTDFELTFKMLGIHGVLNLDDWLFASQVRATPSGSVIAQMDVATDGDLLTISLDHETTAELAAGRYLWDLFGSTPDGRRLRLLEGQATIVNRITVYV